jgi:hypothetical protein
MSKPVQEYVQEAAIYVPASCEGIRIDCYDNDDQRFYGTGEETGEQYCIEYSEVNLEEDMFYQLVLMK